MAGGRGEVWPAAETSKKPKQAKARLQTANRVVKRFVNSEIDCIPSVVFD
jgi:hypothetical protein